MHLFTLNIILFFVLCLTYILLTPIILIKFKNKTLNFIAIITYFIALTIGVFLDISIKGNEIIFNFLIDNKWGNASLSFAFLNPYSIAINLLLLFPLGNFLPLLATNKSKIFLKIAIIGIVTSSVIELLQFILPINRSPEVLDVITNTISSLLGYLYYLFLTKFVLRGEKNDQLSQQENNNSSHKRVCKLWKKRNETRGSYKSY